MTDGVSRIIDSVVGSLLLNPDRTFTLADMVRKCSGGGGTLGVGVGGGAGAEPLGRAVESRSLAMKGGISLLLTPTCTSKFADMMRE